MKKLLIVLDGGCGRGVPSFGGRTVLECAHLPHLNFFVREGKMGHMYPLGENIIPSSEQSVICLLGNDYRLCKRGYYEAIGAGIKLKKGDLALRTNFATIDSLEKKNIIDRRAGRTITSREARLLAKEVSDSISLPYEFEFHATVQHRGVLVLRGLFSDKISSVSSGWKGGEGSEKFEFCEPLSNDKLSRTSAEVVNDFIVQSHKILERSSINKKRKQQGLYPANIVLTRGASAEIPRIKSYSKWLSLNCMPLEVGIARASKMHNIACLMPEMNSSDIYAHLHKLLQLKCEHSIRSLEKHHADFEGCYVHFKEMDNAGHDNKPHEKQKLLEEVDALFFKPLQKLAVKNKWKVVVTCDHATPCVLKGHSADPVPVLVYGEESDGSLEFSEREGMKGSLGKIYGKDFMKKTGLR